MRWYARQPDSRRQALHSHCFVFKTKVRATPSRAASSAYRLFFVEQTHDADAADGSGKKLPQSHPCRIILSLAQRPGDQSVASSAASPMERRPTEVSPALALRERTLSVKETDQIERLRGCGSRPKWPARQARRSLRTASNVARSGDLTLTDLKATFTQA